MLILEDAIASFTLDVEETQTDTFRKNSAKDNVEDLEASVRTHVLNDRLRQLSTAPVINCARNLNCNCW